MGMVAAGAASLTGIGGLSSLVELGGPSNTRSADFTGAEVKALMLMLRDDPDLQANYLNERGPVDGASRLIPLRLWEALFGEPASTTRIGGDSHWIYLASDGQVGITPGPRNLDDDTPVHWIILWTVDSTVSVSGTPVRKDELKALALRMKKRVDGELESSGQLAQRAELSRKWEQEEADRKRQQAADDQRRNEESAKAEEQRGRERDAVHAEKEYWKLRESLPLGGERDAFPPRSQDWIKRRAAVITEARLKGVITVDRNFGFEKYQGEIPLPPIDAVLAALRKGTSIPVTAADAGSNQEPEPNSPREATKGSKSKQPSDAKSVPALAVSPFDVAQAKAHQHAWATHLGVTVERTNAVGMKFTLIPPGEFQMGNPDSVDDATPPTKPQHRVRISRAFYSGMHEVTIAAFRQFIDDANYRTDAEKEGIGGSGYDLEKSELVKKPEYTWKEYGVPRGEDHPVNNVSWNDATAFCEWLTSKTGQTHRLLTEAEWEYACRAGTTTRFSNGDDLESLTQVGNVADATGKAKFPAWTTIAAADGFVFTSPVGSFRPNAFGLFDMHGNVTEWCQDWHHADEYAARATRATRIAIDPVRTDPPSQRVFRGGDFIFHPNVCGSASRSYAPPSFRDFRTGFRVAITLQPPAEVINPATKNEPQDPNDNKQKNAQLVEAALGKRVSLRAPYPTVDKSEKGDRITVQFAVKEIGRQAGVGYDFEASLKNADPECRRWVKPVIRNMPCRDALEAILKPAGLTYRLEGNAIVLQRRK
ncbi:MAG: SUMF1/EgtB/PvdO family nonheme iron enzyme [Planctomycetaceae bacterium]|nr:SUMF1/EgtB/PvdO family nonheme iron enzyme [Planctomycetaceae bacterium]